MIFPRQFDRANREATRIKLLRQEREALEKRLEEIKKELAELDAE